MPLIMAPLTWPPRRLCHSTRSLPPHRCLTSRPCSSGRDSSCAPLRGSRRFFLPCLLSGCAGRPERARAPPCGSPTTPTTGSFPADCGGAAPACASRSKRPSRIALPPSDARGPRPHWRPRRSRTRATCLPRRAAPLKWCFAFVAGRSPPAAHTDSGPAALACPSRLGSKRWLASGAANSRGKPGPPVVDTEGW